MDWYWYVLIYLAGAATVALLSGFLEGLSLSGHVSEEWGPALNKERNDMFTRWFSIGWPVTLLFMLAFFLWDLPVMIGNFGRKLGQGEPQPRRFTSED